MSAPVTPRPQRAVRMTELLRAVELGLHDLNAAAHALRTIAAADQHDDHGLAWIVHHLSGDAERTQSIYGELVEELGYDVDQLNAYAVAIAMGPGGRNAP